jgi:hypothetical protein
VKRVLFFIALCLIYPQLAAAADPSKKALFKSEDALLTKQVLRTKVGSTVFYAADDEVADMDEGEGKASAAAISTRGYSLMRIAPSELKEKLADPSSPYRRVFYSSPMRSEETRYVSTGRILVQLQQGVSVGSLASEKHLVVVKTVNAAVGIYLLEPSSRLDLVQQCNELNTMPQVKYASPEWIRPVLLR